MPVAALAAALALAGCGGSDNKPAPPVGPKGNVQCLDGSSASSVAACPKPAGVPLTGDDLAEAEAIKKGLDGFGNGLPSDVTSLEAMAINTSDTGKMGTPKSNDPKWSDHTVPAVGGGWTAKGYMRKTDDGTEHIYSYSSGAPHIDRPLKDWLAAQNTGNTGISQEGESVDFAARAYDADLFGDGFRGAKLDDDKELEGTFAGLKGTFKCTITCDRTIDKDGKIVLLDGWEFDPDGKIADLEVKAKYSKHPNPEFMTFGHWSHGKEDGSFEVDAFAAGEAARRNLPGADTEIVSASYSGKASGGYVREVLDGSKKVPAAKGLFTADVTLSAVFAGTTNTVQGSIHNFMDDGSKPIGDWKLILKGTTAIDDDFNNGGFFAGTAGKDGKYRGQFYGDDGADEAASEAPVGAAGVFDSGTTFDNGRASGAFGTTLDE